MTTPPPLARATIRPGTIGREPLTFGVPVAPGRVHEVARLVATAGAALPTSATALERWPDGSVRWALLDVVADVPATDLVLDIRDDLAAAEAPSLTFSGADRTAVVTDGHLRVALDLDDPRLLVEATTGGRAALACSAPIVHLRDRAGQTVAIAWSRLEVSHQTALRVVAIVHGVAALPEGARLDVRLRLTLLAGEDVLGLGVEIHNPRRAQHDGGFWELGDPGSVLLQGVALVCATPTPPIGATLSLARGDAPAPVALPCAVVQHASGGDAWQSRVHVNAAGVVPLDTRGCTVQAAGETTAALRATPMLTCAHEGGALGVTARLFWELFPKAYEADADGVMRLWSLPVTRDLHELQGGERCDFECWIAVGRARAGDGVPEWCRTPSTVLPDIDGVARAEHLPALQPARPGDNDTYEGLVTAAVEGDDTFLAKRELIDEFGWRHFGDLYADHENGTEPGRRFISHYNNQYDAVLGMTLQALRHDDHRWWRMAADLARHVSRIDIYWTREDRAAYNGGQFWHTGHYTDAGTSTHRTYPRNAGLHGGGPSNEQCYSHGLLLHYFLTGDPVSREAVISLADWMIAADDGTRARAPLPWLSAAPTGGASATESADYHGPGRGVANAVLALMNAHRVTGDDRYAAKAVALVRRVIHPGDDIAALRLLDIERRWSYTVCLQALGRLLWLGATPGGDDISGYARACLLHYARWMADHEYCYLDKPEVLEFPTETWAAQDIRKSEVFDLAAWHAPSLDERARFLERARYFHARSLATLADSPTRTRTRPVVLLLQYGYARPWFERETPAAPLRPAPAGPWPPASRFEPQKTIAIRRLKQLAAAGAVAALAAAALLVRAWAS